MFIMKILIFVLCTILSGTYGIGLTLLDEPGQDVTAKTCAKGPVYWCENLATAKFCGAMQHCIQTVWEHKQLAVDNDEICDICKDMVKQARDQLESNETQEDIKAVFEGSCNLIPIKMVSKECCKIADEFIPELVETLASQMNPQVVCSVAGLCNNAQIDSLLQNKKVTSKDCKNCDIVVSEVKNKFDAASRDDVLAGMLEICGRFGGSYSDGCSAAVITYFNDIYSHLKKNFESGSFCHLAGVCSSKFHSHRKDIEITYESSVGIVTNTNDNVPCELCEDLVKHLRDILIANTTEDEFRDMLIGICKQTKSFQSECMSLVDQYYQMAYEFIVNSLDPAEVCIAIQLCPENTHRKQAPVWPLVTSDVAEAASLITAEKVELKKIPATSIVPAQKVESSDDTLIPWIPLNTAVKQEAGGKLHRVSLSKDDSAVRASHSGIFQLPAERLMPHVMLGAGNKDVCAFCQYFLHYVQQAITMPKSEIEIKELVENACSHLPKSVSVQCRNFVETYGNAAIAILAQDIDPSLVCPALNLCPGDDGILLDPSTTVKDKPACPLCLLAVQEIISKLKDNKTEDNIKKELETLCNNLPKSLAPECVQFVNTYADMLVEMLVADFTAQEVCTYLELCDPSGEHVSAIDSDESIEIISNEIPPLPMERMMPQSVVSTQMKKQKVGDSSVCIICEFIMSKLENILKENSTDEEIKEAVHSICNIMPSTVSKECNDFVNQYADLIITFLSETLDPKQVCAAIDLCKTSSAVRELKRSFAECAVCEAAVGALEALVGEDPTINGKITSEIKKVCTVLPKEDQRQCDAIVATYGPSIVNLMTEMVGSREICLKIGLCLDEQRQTVKLLGGKRCTWGPGYWCQSVAHAAACKTTKHCEEFVWKGKKTHSN